MAWLHERHFPIGPEVHEFAITAPASFKMRSRRGQQLGQSVFVSQEPIGDDPGDRLLGEVDTNVGFLCIQSS